MSDEPHQNRVLIIDDSPDTLRMLAHILEAEGYQVLQAPNGMVGIQIAEFAIPDLILLDIQMPGVGGYETCQRLKSIEKLKSIPVIFVSGRNEIIDKVKAFEIGGVDYIAKPYQKDELLARVHTHLRLRELTERLETKVRERTQELASANQMLQREIGERERTEVALRESEENFRRIFETMQDGYLRTDMDGIILLANLATAKMLHYEAGELFGKNLVAEIHVNPYDHERLKESLEKEGRVKNFEIPFRCKDGEIIITDCNVQFIFDDAGKPIAIEGIIRDITERVRAQQLEEAVYRISHATNHAENLEALYLEIHAAIFEVMSAENFYIALYEKESDLLNFSFFMDEVDPHPGQQPLGKGLTEYVLRTGESLLCDQIVYKELEQSGEIELIGPPSPIWLGVPLKVENQVIGVMVVQHYRDPHVYGQRELRILEYVSTQVAEAIALKRTSDELSQTQALFQAAIDNSPAGIIIAEAPDGIIRTVNQAALDIRGPAEVPLRDIPMSLHPQNWKCYNQDYQLYAPADLPLSQAILKKKRIENVELIIGDPEGEHRWVLVNAAPILDHAGKVIAGIAVFPDISALKQTEDALQESEERYRAIVEDQTELIVRWLPDGTLTFANDSYCRFFQFSYEELVGKEFIHRVMGEDRNIVNDAFRRLTPEYEVVSYEERVTAPNGEIRWLMWTDRGFFDAHGQLQAIQSVARDITDRKRADEKIQQQLQRLAALRRIDSTITASLDLNLSLNLLLDELITQLEVDAADILLLNRHMHTLEYKTGRGFHMGSPRQNYRLGFGLAGKVALERNAIIISGLDPQADAAMKEPFFESEGFTVYVGIPLVAKGHVKGVLEIFQRQHIDLELDWLDYLKSLGGQATIAIENAELFENLQHSNLELTLAYNNTLEGWARALELRDFETKGHSQRVTDITLKLARAMGVREDELIHIHRGALLHDIGKMGIPDRILLKPGPLDDEEWQIMRQHPTLAYEMLLPIAYLRPALEIPYAHHEKWDGTGYPLGLAGEQIPLSARLFSVIDVWDALTSDRPYRLRWSDEKALNHICEQIGTAFDPQVVEAFMQIIDSGN
ncbi:MAG TPA: hypothetical protein DEH25_04885 [Chloroflexi bacterium]|nr:hypothetical protein [Chloroflexota bacterium]